MNEKFIRVSLQQSPMVGGQFEASSELDEKNGNVVDVKRKKSVRNYLKQMCCIRWLWQTH